MCMKSIKIEEGESKSFTHIRVEYLTVCGKLSLTNDSIEAYHKYFDEHILKDDEDLTVFGLRVYGQCDVKFISAHYVTVQNGGTFDAKLLTPCGIHHVYICDGGTLKIEQYDHSRSSTVVELVEGGRIEGPREVLENLINFIYDPCGHCKPVFVDGAIVGVEK